MIDTNKSTLDPSSYTPLYIQIAHILRESIANGEFKKDEKLPSEKELVQHFCISRITAIAALDELVKARLAYREPGRGSFVAQPFLSNFSFFSSFTEDMRARGLEPNSRLVSLSIQKPDLEMLKKLQMVEDSEYFCLVRVRLVNHEPIVLQSAYLPQEMYPNFEKVNFNELYLYEVMRKIYGFKPTWGEAIVEASAATPIEGEELGIKHGDPVLIIWHITLDDRFAILEYVRSVYRSDRFSFATGRNLLSTFTK